MADTAIAPNYDLIIHRQQKRISQLKADLARYSSKLRQLKTRASESHQAALAAAAAAAAAATAAHANPNDFARAHAAQLQAAMFMAAPAVAPSNPTAAPFLQPHLPPHPHQPTHEFGAAAALQAGGRVGGGGGVNIVPPSQRGRGGNGEEDDKAGKTRYWTEMEHNQFLYAVKLFGPKNYVAISQYVATRTPKQVRTHAQKYQMRLEREAKKRRAQAAAAAAARELAIGKGDEAEKSVSTCPEEIEEMSMLREGACSPVSDEEGGKIGEKDECVMRKNTSVGNLADYDDFMRRITSAVHDAKTEGSEMFDSESNDLDMDILNEHPKTEQFEDSLLADL